MVVSIKATMQFISIELLFSHLDNLFIARVTDSSLGPTIVYQCSEWNSTKAPFRHYTTHLLDYPL